jgi:type VI secretion system ImpM family protein
VGFLSRFRKPSADDPPPMESWPLFAFGKLPVYKDFISAGLTDDVSREFRDWLSNGFSRHWSARDDCRSAEIPLHAFLFRLPQSRKMAVGALWGSTDQGGLRKFPFALFTILPAGKPATSVLAALDYLPVFEKRAREIRRKYDAAGSLAAVYQELRGARIEIPVRKEEQIRLRLSEALARSRIGHLATALFGDDAATQWAALLSGLDTAARSPTAGAAAFRLPLADEAVPLHQLQLWTIRLTKFSQSGAAPTGVLYRTGGTMPCGVIFFRDARAEDILLFHPAAIPTDFVEEIPKPAGRKVPEASTEAAGIEPKETSAPKAVPEPTAPSEPTAAAEPTPAAELTAPTQPPAAVEPTAATEPAGAAEPTAAAEQAAATEPAPIEPAVIELPAPGMPPSLEPPPPVNTTPPSEAAPQAGARPPTEEILLLGAAAKTADIRPAPVPAAPAHDAAPEVPAVSEEKAESSAPELPAAPEPTATPTPVAPTTAAPAADASPTGPAGWDLPLASLLEAR